VLNETINFKTLPALDLRNLLLAPVEQNNPTKSTSQHQLWEFIDYDINDY